jgi:hypothetical protein
VLEELPSFKPSSGEEFVNTVKAMELATYPYISAIAKSAEQPLSFLQNLEPEGLKKDVADEVFNSYVSKRPLKIMLDGADGGEGSSKRSKPAEPSKTPNLEQVFENPSPLQALEVESLPPSSEDDLFEGLDTDSLYDDVGNKALASTGEDDSTPEATDLATP